jgi:hypothetical protein
MCVSGLLIRRGRKATASYGNAKRLIIKKDDSMTEPTTIQATSNKEVLGEKSISALAPASTVGVVIAAVLLFTPWFAIEDPFFGMLHSINAFDAISPLLETVLAYPLIGLYLIAVGSLWANRAELMPLGIALTLAYLSLLGASFLILNVLEFVFSNGGTIDYGLLGSAAFTLGFGLWALTHDTFLKPKQKGSET